jgi:hypothetical protein
VANNKSMRTAAGNWWQQGGAAGNIASTLAGQWKTAKAGRKQCSSRQVTTQQPTNDGSGKGGWRVATRGLKAAVDDWW